MSKTYIYTSIILMAVVTYLIRVISVVLLRKEIKSRFFRSFLYYAPYVTLSSLTFPAMILATENASHAAISFICSLLCAFITESLPLTTVLSCVVVFVASLI